jgi:hypothetical protein
MLTIVKTEMSPEDHYETLDLMLTELFQAAAVEYTEDVLTHLLAYDRRLQIALGLPVEVAS